MTLGYVPVIFWGVMEGALVGYPLPLVFKTPNFKLPTTVCAIWIQNLWSSKNIPYLLQNASTDKIWS